jgi:drug/metabolite transporter (DMT)-like permease
MGHLHRGAWYTARVQVPATVVLAVLAGALLHAAWNALLKSSEAKQLDSAALAAGAGILALGAALWMPLPTPAAYPWLVTSALIHIVYFAALVRAYQLGDLSFTYPIMRGGGPVVVALASALGVGDVLSPTQVAGVALVSVGVLAFASQPSADPATLRMSLAVALVNAVVIGAYTLVDAQGARLSGAPVSYALWFFVLNGVVISTITLMQRRTAMPLYLQWHWRRAAISGACTVGSYAVALWGMTQAPIGLVAALRETSVVFAALIGAVFLGEPLTLRRTLATLCVVAGLVVLRS